MRLLRHILIVAAVAAFLSGCGSSGGDDPAVPAWCLQQYSTDTPQTFDSGLVLEPSSQMYVAPEEVEWFYQELLACVGQTYPQVAGTIGPSVVFTSFKAEGIDAYMGFYTSGCATCTTYQQPTVAINTDDPLGRRSCSSDESTLKHELLHHVIYINGLPLSFTEGPGGSYPDPHGSPLFNQCVPEFIDAGLDS